MTRLLEHLSADYRDIYEFRELSATVSKDLYALDLDWQRVEDDQFIMSSSEPAILRREKEFKILPDRKTETLDFRKRRLLVRMQSNPPYVVAYLKNLLVELLGENRHIIDLDKLLFEMEVLVHVESTSYYDEVVKLLERIVPLNIDLTTAVLLIQEYLVLRTAIYSFPVTYRRTNKFGTASIAGSGRLTERASLGSGAYPFPIDYKRTNKFRTPTVSGAGTLTEEAQIASVAYGFNMNLPVTGKMITRSG